MTSPSAQYQRAWRAANRARYNAYMRSWRAANPGYEKRRGRDHHPREMERHYQITELEYAALLYAQDGLCAVCQRPELGTFRGRPKRLSVDHDHETGRVRGLLCSRCNRGIGYLQDSPEDLYRAAVYLS